MAMKMKTNFDPYIVECLAIRKALKFAKDSDLCVAIVESDSLNVVNAIRKVDEFALERPIIDDIFLLCGNVGGGTCCFTLRNENKATHKLAQFSLSLNSVMYWMEDISNCISHIVVSDLDTTIS